MAHYEFMSDRLCLGLMAQPLPCCIRVDAAWQVVLYKNKRVEAYID